MAFDDAFVEVAPDLWFDPHGVLGGRVHTPQGLYEDTETPYHVDVLVFAIGWVNVDAETEESAAQERLAEILLQVYNSRD